MNPYEDHDEHNNSLKYSQEHNNILKYSQEHNNILNYGNLCRISSETTFFLTRGTRQLVTLQRLEDFKKHY